MRLFHRRRTPESWYAPTRYGITMGCSIVAGVFGAIVAGLTQWDIINVAEDFGRGFGRYELAVGIAAVEWGLAGAAVGWLIGFVWERWHRYHRAPARPDDATPPPGAFPAIPEQPTLTTARLVLRPFRLTDADRVQAVAGTREVADTTLRIPHPYPAGAAARWIATLESHWRQGRSVVYAITEGAGGLLVGAVGLEIDAQNASAELGYWIAPDRWNLGYATEAAGALLELGFSTLGLNRIQARHFTRNASSGRVMQKLGMQPEGVQRQLLRKWDRFEDAAIYSVLRSEWTSRPAVPARAVRG